MRKTRLDRYVITPRLPKWIFCHNLSTCHHPHKMLWRKNEQCTLLYHHTDLWFCEHVLVQKVGLQNLCQADNQMLLCRFWYILQYTSEELPFPLEDLPVPKQFEDIINLVNSSWFSHHVGGQSRAVRCSLHSLCPDLSWYNNYPSRSGRNDFTLLTYCDQWWEGGECGRPSSLSKSRQEYNIICYILTGSSHTHISQLMVLKIARVSISNDVEMSPVSL